MPIKRGNRRKSHGCRKIKVSGQPALFGSLLEFSNTGDQSRLEVVIEQPKKRTERLPVRRKQVQVTEMVKNNFIPDFDRIQNYQLCVEPYNQSQPTEQSNSSESKSSEVHMGDSQGPVVLTTALMEQTSTPYTNAKRLSAVKENSIPKINLSPVPIAIIEEENTVNWLRTNRLSDNLDHTESPSILYRSRKGMTMTRRTTSPFDFVDPQDSEVQSVSDERLEMETSSGRNQSEITQSPRVVGSCVRVLRSRTIRFHHSSINNPPNIGTPNSRSATGSGSDMELRNESTSMSANPQASMDVDMSVQMMSELSLKDQQTSKEDKQINEDSVQLASVDMSIANETKEELMEIKSKVICETEELQNTKEPYQLDGSAVPMTSLMEITVDRSALISVDNRQHQSSCVKSEKSKLYTPQFKMVSSSLMGGSYLSSPIQNAYSPRTMAIDAKTKLMEQCQQTSPIPFGDCIPENLMASITKIGEGVYGEVFRAALPGEDTTVYKIIPIEGNFSVNDEAQKTFEGILPEIVIARELSLLRERETNRTPNYCEVRKVSCVKGAYPKQLLRAWDQFNDSGRSENDRPDVFDENQLFIVFEFGDGGTDLESAKLKTVAEAESIVHQVAISLYIAEKELHFEHRDLHIGNILIKETASRHIEYLLDDRLLRVPSHGYQVFLIDFTLSRVQKDQMIIYTDLADDDLLFAGEGDYQFDIYRLMKECHNNCWDSYDPYTNVLWLHYLVDKLLTKKTYNGKKLLKRAGVKLRRVYDTILGYKGGAGEFVEGDEFFDEIFNV